MTTPLLFCARGAAIAVDDALAFSELTFSSSGDLVVVTGECGPLMAVLTGTSLALDLTREQQGAVGEATLCAGEIEISGRSVGLEEHFETSGMASFDPQMPPTWTILEYVEWSARLRGVSKSAARHEAKAVLHQMGLEGSFRRRIRELAKPERCVVGLAQALVGDPTVLILEAPLGGLEGSEADYVGRALDVARTGRRAIISVWRLDPGTPEGGLARRASDLLVLLGGKSVASGPPTTILAGHRTYALTVEGEVRAFRTALVAMGLAVAGDDRMVVSLPAGATVRDILEASDQTEAVVVELQPLF